MQSLRFNGTRRAGLKSASEILGANLASLILAVALAGCTTTTIHTGDTYTTPPPRSAHDSYSRSETKEFRQDPSLTRSKEGCPCSRPDLSTVPVVQQNREIAPAAVETTAMEERGEGTPLEEPASQDESLVAPASESEALTSPSSAPPGATPEEEAFFQGLGGGDEDNDTPRELMEEEVKNAFQHTSLLTIPAAEPPVKGSAEREAPRNDGKEREIKRGDFAAVGTASWYGRDFDGRKTASGEIFDSRKLTAAHRDIPLGSIVLVRNLENGKEVLVTVNDRGPYVKGRIIDLSEYGAELLGYKHQGLTTVGIKVVRTGNGKRVGPGVTSDFYNSREEESSLPGMQNGSFSYISAALERGEVTEESESSAMPSLSAAEKEKVLASLKPEGSLKGYSVQVGVFEKVEHAIHMREYLKPYGEPVHIMQRGSLYVVKVGKFRTRYSAEQLKYQLVADGYRGFVTEPGR